MNNPAFVTTEESASAQRTPILIVDKEDIFGADLCSRLRKDFLIVLVSKRKPILDSPTKGEASDIIHIPYIKKLPTIPDNKYSHIFLIDDENSSQREFLPVFLRKAEQDISLFIFITSLYKTNGDLILSITKAHKNTKVVVYGDVFGEHIMKTNNLSSINSFIYQAVKFGRIEIIGDGTKKMYPVFNKDAVSSILEIIFGSHSTHPVFYLFPKHPPMQLSVAHMIQRDNPSVKIDFVKEDKIEKEPSLSFPGEYILPDNYSIERKIKELNMENKPMEEEATDNISGVKNNKRSSFFVMTLIFIMFFLLLSPVLTLLSSVLAYKSLNDIEVSIKHNNFKDLKQEIYLSNFFSTLALEVSKPLLFEVRIIGAGQPAEQFRNTLAMGEKASEDIKNSLSAFDAIKKIFEGKDTAPKEDFAKAVDSLSQVIITLKETEALGYIPSPVLDKIRKYNSFLTLPVDAKYILPDILGMYGKKTYLVFFQNNMELRPTGGFIGSYGLLTIDKGKIVDFSIHDVYDADGQLKGHVEPPYPIRRFLPSKDWYLRDSNFDIDFTRASSVSALLLSSETGEMVNGVIGVDMSFVKKILFSIGPVYLSQYKETVSSDNLFYLAEAHAEKNFFPSSSQKKDFLRFLFEAIKTKLSSEKNLPYITLARSIMDSIAEKHLLLAFSDPGIQSFFTIKRWSSSLWDDRKQSSRSVNDFVGINEANLGANKANYFISRSVSQNVSIDKEGSISSKLTIAYKNTSTGTAWPGGDYKNYLRIILPYSARLSGITIDGISRKIVTAVTNPKIYEAKKFTPPEGLEVNKSYEEGKTKYGFLVIVPSGALKTITVKYTLSQRVSKTDGSFSYSLYIFKQPGTDAYPYDFTLSYPSSYIVSNVPKGIAGKRGSVSFSEELSQDKEFSISFAKI